MALEFFNESVDEVSKQDHLGGMVVADRCIRSELRQQRPFNRLYEDEGTLVDRPGGSLACRFPFQRMTPHYDR